MLQTKSPDLDSIRADLNSPNPDKRAYTIDRLIHLMQQRPELQPAAREIFEQTIQTDTAVRPLSAAVAGLEKIDGPDTTRPMWLAMLTNPDPKYVYQAALRICHPTHAPMVRELLESERDASVQTALIRALGSMRDKQSISLLMRFGNAPGTGVRLWVITALGLIGDPSAIPWLEQFRNDPTPIPEERGAPRTLGDDAADAIRRLSAKGGAPVQPAFSASNATATDPASQHRTPPPLFIRAPSQAPLLKVLKIAAAVPLIAAVIQIGWLIFLVMAYIFICGDRPPPKLPISERQIDAIAVIPSVCGVVAAILILITGRAPGWRRKLLLWIGFAICGLFVLGFYRDLLSPSS